MRTTQFLSATLKETPAEAEVISHQLMLRAGMIRKVASGIYTWLPLGLRVLRKVESIVREEMNCSGAQEILMPNTQPAELWQESGRWEQYGPDLLRYQDRHGRDFCFGPTHEEIVTDLARKELKSYKQLPTVLYQIQTKFRDEIRPRFGVMRGREFLMKDAYSFDLDEESLVKTYQLMHETYHRIFNRLGLDFRAVEADTGSIGGDCSHEFQVLANSGEDTIAFSDTSDYAANTELATSLPQATSSSQTSLIKIETPEHKTILEVSKLLGVPPSHTVKILIVKGSLVPFVALCLRGDDELNPIKAEKHPAIAAPLTMASDEEINATGLCKGFIGPMGLKIPLIVDKQAAAMEHFIAGANEIGFHYDGINWQKDVGQIDSADLRSVKEGDLSPDGKGKLVIKRGIEVGHIFQLKTKYSEALKANVLGPDGKAKTLSMGCYGIGVSRIVAAAIEQNHDNQGIIWPAAMAPFQAVIIPVGMSKSPRVEKASNSLYTQLLKAGIEVLFDDRNERPGVLFSHADLLGIPHRIVIGEKGLDANVVEYKHRKEQELHHVNIDEIFQFILEKTST